MSARCDGQLLLVQAQRPSQDALIEGASDFMYYVFVRSSHQCEALPPPKKFHRKSEAKKLSTSKAGDAKSMMSLLQNGNFSDLDDLIAGSEKSIQHCTMTQQTEQLENELLMTIF
jgi:hypothetical protein